MSPKNQRACLRVVLGTVCLTLTMTLSAMAPRESSEDTMENARSFAPSTQDASAGIDIDMTHSVGPVNKLLLGNYVIAVFRGIGILDKNQQFNADALQMIRELQPSILRFAVQPIFEDGIGDPQSRPPARW